ncbi:MAG: cation:proton antiporter [Spirochaetae bacterium HGW-Spirochaetae-3]|jgi:multicomponent Na+:H+ antiporter subunit E|nr:MAG: cation:proton antiporter [Spirochaetae bacterium HGW-Spirochaetae-3]
MRPRSLWKLIRILATFAVLIALWFLFSGSFSPASILTGIGCSALIALISYNTFIDEHEAARNMVFPRLLPALAYPFRLVAAMYAASFRTLASVLSGRVSPRVVHFRSRLKSDIARVALAEAITFTPGTISIELDEDHFIVHWLNATTRHSARAGDEVKGPLEAAIKRIWV